MRCSGPWRVAAFHARNVLHDGKSFVVRTTVRNQNAEREGFEGAGESAGPARRSYRRKSVEKGRPGQAGLATFADLEGVLANLLVGAARDRCRQTAREKLRAELETDHERDRNRQNPRNYLRKDDGVALRHVVGISGIDLCTVAPARGKRKPWWNAALTSGAQDRSTDPHGHCRAPLARDEDVDGGIGQMP
jgi:hypothetical protein